MKSSSLITLLSLIIYFSRSCSDNNNPVNTSEEIFDKKLDIVTGRSEYNLNEITYGDFVFIKAVLTNKTPDTLYSNLGDRFNSSIDQDYLSIAQGTDGHFEKNAGGNKWNNLTLGFLSEGSRIIRIYLQKLIILPQALFQITVLRVSSD